MRTWQLAGSIALAAAGALFGASLLAPPRPTPSSASPPTPLEVSASALPISIEGPASITAGELAVLSIAGEAELVAWQAIPATPNFLAIDGGRRAVFTSPHAGSWTFVLAASDRTELIQTAHTVTVAGPVPPGPPGPKPPDPSATLAAQVRIWRSRITSPTAAAEAQRLALSFESVAAQIAAGALKTPEAIIQATASANQVALGPARDAWRSFFELLRTELNRREQTAPLDYPALWREIAGGLLSAALPEPKGDRR